MNSSSSKKIVAFLCNWCAYEAADGAGRAGLAVHGNLRAIRVPCSGRVSPRFVLQAFQSGADAVLVIGCRPGQCHYRQGIERALRQSRFVLPILEQFGIPRERFRVAWASADEHVRFVEIVNDMAKDLL